jgi:transcription elongation factor GreA
MASQDVVLTAEGLKKVTAELDELKGVARKRVADRIREAKQFGEIGENSEYEAAKAEQALVEGRIETLQYLLQTARIVDGPEDDSRVSVGSTVRLRDAGSKVEVVYHIVGALEADPSENRISNQSPIGEALIGHAAGDTLKVHTPSGLHTFVIVSVSR